MSFCPSLWFNMAFHTSVWVTLFSEQMEYQRTFIKITWQTEGCPLDFFYHILYTSIAVFTSELLTCYFILDASVTPIKTDRKDKWVVTHTHLDILFCQVRPSNSRVPESIVTDSQPFRIPASSWIRSYSASPHLHGQHKKSKALRASIRHVYD